MSEDFRDYFVTARAGAPFGVEGFFRVNSLSGETAHITKLKRLTLRQGEKSAVFAVERFLEKGGVLVKLSGIDSPEEARKWRGADIIVLRGEAAPLSKDEFYIEDLKTLTLVSPSGAKLGIVRDVVEGGGGFLLDIVLAGGNETRLVPFRGEFIGAISFETRCATLLAEWILE